MAFDNCDPVWRSVCGLRRRGIARHKDQESFRAIAHTESQTPKEESDTHSIARELRRNERKLLRVHRQPRRRKASQSAKKHLLLPHRANPRRQQRRRLQVRRKHPNRLEEKRAGRMLHFRLTKLRTTTAIRQRFAKSWTPASP